MDNWDAIKSRLDEYDDFRIKASILVCADTLVALMHTLLHLPLATPGSGQLDVQFRAVLMVDSLVKTLNLSELDNFKSHVSTPKAAWRWLTDIAILLRRGDGVSGVNVNVCILDDFYNHLQLSRGVHVVSMTRNLLEYSVVHLFLWLTLVCQFFWLALNGFGH